MVTTINMKLLSTALLLTMTMMMAEAESAVKSAFQRSHIEPDVIDVSPELYLYVKFPSGVEASLGNQLTPTQVKNEPIVSYESVADSYYTLIFIDPDNYDGPDPVYREFQHWLVGNIPGDCLNQGEVLTQYISSGPLWGTGFHRYTFLLFKQPGKLEFDVPRLNNTSIVGRDRFSSRKFAEKYDLGIPIAGNFYEAQYDDYVPILYASVGAEDLLNSS